jgi:hypothetical protein|tara:strand:+ start:461 stop:649 length:189 start_codon:yes stop_codon:yes gene_type:complete
MTDGEKIDHLIEVINQLKQMCNELDDPKCNHHLVLGLMVAIIASTPVPDVTILPNYRSMAIA